MRKVGWLLVLALGLSPGLHGQSTEESGKGFIWYESLTGTTSSLGTVSRFDSTVGYNFNRFFAVDAGAPVLFVHASSSATTTSLRSASGIGDAYTDVRVTFLNPVVNVGSNLRVTAPTGSTQNGFSSGRATADWTNHFDHTFGHVTPFANLGVANTVPDSSYFVRPYTTLGITGHFEGGASVRLMRRLNLRASAYAIEPTGQQKVFSRFLNRNSGPANNPGSSSHGPFQNSPETTGTADIARDHGASIGLDSTVLRVLDLAAGYTHSASFSLNTFYFGVGVNLARFLGSTSH